MSQDKLKASQRKVVYRKVITYTEEELATELWKEPLGIVEIPYLISTLGRVKNKPRRVYAWNGGWRDIPERFVNLYLGPRGYLTFSLGKYRRPGMSRFLHNLVATTFIPNPEGKKEVNHKDADKQNNRISNLEWATRAENAAHAAELGLYPRGARNNKTRITDEQVLEIRIRLQNGEKGNRIAKEFGVCTSTISHINTGRNRSRTYPNALKNAEVGNVSG